MSSEYIVNYLQPGGSPVYDQRHLGPGSEQLVERVDQQVVRVQDGRREPLAFTLDRSGFELVAVDFGFHRFDQDSEIQQVLYPKVISWMKTRLGAAELLIFDHTFRSKSRSELSVHNRAPVKTVHNDYTASSADHRLREETRLRPQLRNRRYQFINLWMPVYHRVEESPLAMVDLQSVAPADYHPLKLIYPDRVGELAAISYNPAHRWVYFSGMQPGEALLLKVYDSQMPPELNGVPHSAVDSVRPQGFAKARSSLEIRTIAFFEEH